MTGPDLSTPEARAAYRQELRKVAPWLRRLGFLLVIFGAGLILWGSGDGPDRAVTVGYGALALGWAMALLALIRRTLYQQRRARS